MTLTFEPSHVDLEIPRSDALRQGYRQRALVQSQSHSTPAACWNAYLNQLCLNAVLPWLQEEFAPQAKVWRGIAALPSFWEFINGIPIILGKTKLLLVPSEANDTDELRVAQEWIDIPSWTADYYLAIQIDPDEGLAKIWGYTTHLQLKTKGRYDASDRTYSLNAEDAIADPTVLWVARQIGIEETTKAEVPALQPISIAQAENLLQRLGDSNLVAPRLAVPFSFWGALLEHGGWRQRLYEKRLGRSEARSLLQWMRSGISELSQQWGWQQFNLQPAGEGARGESTNAPTTLFSRQLEIEDSTYELRLLPLGNPAEGGWRFELLNAVVGEKIPSGLKLRLLTEDLQPFENNEDVATEAVERLYVDVAIAPGEGIVWEVEPSSEDCDREILRF
jgi:hypothetical protein